MVGPAKLIARAGIARAGTTRAGVFSLLTVGTIIRLSAGGISARWQKVETPTATWTQVTP